MGCPTQTQLKSMARSLQQQIDVANELQMDFAAQLLAMTVMEVTTKIHGITQQELNALCECIEESLSPERKQATEPISGLRNFDRRSRSRRSRG
jgi:hypothetical protein